MLILKNATLLQFDPPMAAAGQDVVIKDSEIIEVGGNAGAEYQPDAAEVIDLNGNYLLPGIVCSHNHFYSGLARGIIAAIKPCPDFVSILKNLWWRLDRAIDQEILYYSGLICSLEAVKAGTTAVIDHHASPSLIKGSLNILKKAFTEAGLRGITCFEVTDRNGPEQMREGVEENMEFAAEVGASRKSGGKACLVEAMIGGHAPFTLPDEGLELLSGAVAQSGCGLHLHVGEGTFDGSHSHLYHGKDLVERLNDFNLLNEKTIVVHGLYITENDIKLLNDNNCYLVHNPRSNMNNSIGYNLHLARIKNVALGTDGIGSNMFEELKFAYFKHKDSGGPLWPDNFLKFLQNGNDLLERNFGLRFGRIEKGYQADLVVYDYQPPTPLVAENLAGHMVFGMGSDSVKTVIINGKVVYRDRQFPFDTDSIYRKARSAARRLWDNMDSEAAHG